MKLFAFIILAQITIIVSRQDVTEITFDDADVATTNSYTCWTWSAPQTVGQLQSSLTTAQGDSATASNRIVATVRALLPKINPTRANEPVKVEMP